MSSSEAPIRVRIVDFHTGRDLPGRTVVQTTTCGRLDGMTAFSFFFSWKIDWVFENYPTPVRFIVDQ